MNSSATFWKEISEIAKNCATIIGICIGGWWTLIRFGWNRERYAKLEFNLDVNILGTHKNEYVLELVAVVENKGTVRQRLENWTFDLRFLTALAEINKTSEIIDKQLEFESEIEKRHWVQSGWHSPFIDGGTSKRFIYMTSISMDATYLLLISKFIDPDETNDFISSAKAFSIEEKLKSKQIMPASEP